MYVGFIAMIRKVLKGEQKIRDCRICILVTQSCSRLCTVLKTLFPCPWRDISAQKIIQLNSTIRSAQLSVISVSFERRQLCTME